VTPDTPRRGPGRPPTGRPRKRHVQLTLADDVIEYLDLLAEGWQTTRTGAVERLVRKLRSELRSGRVVTGV
jgi:uncharacterized protein (DUF4415 family)